MAYKVFISYSTADLVIANHLHSLLHRPSSIEVFIAEYSVPAGTPLAQALLDTIRGCDLFVLLWSQNSRWSEWVPQEIGIARSSNKVILPVVLQPHLTPPGFISDLKYLAAYQDLSNSLNWLQQYVLTNAKKQQQAQAVTLLLLGGLALWALGSSQGSVR